MHRDDRFKYFGGWCSKYFAEVVARDSIDSVIEYIKNQESHHGAISLEDEMVNFYSRNHWIFLPEYFD